MSEAEMILLAQQGDEEALLCLYRKYLPLFKKLCRNRADYSNILDCDDLLQECFLALKSTVNSYSFERGASFKTYLYSCVKWHLNRVIAKHSNVTENQLTLILQIKKFRENYEKKHGRMPDNALVMREFFISRDYLRELDILKDLKITSIDVPIGEDDESTLADLLPSETDLEERTVKRLSIVQLWEFLESCLLPEELKIIELLYLERQTFKNVAEMTGKTEAEIQTIQKRSLKKLRKKEKLKDYLQ